MSITTLHRTFAASLLALGCLTLAPAAHAISNGGEITDEELALLPPWCNYTQTFRGASKNNKAYFDYMKKYGGSWSHIHHYCWAMAGMMRFDREPIGSQHRGSLLRSAIGNVDYSLERSSEDFAFWYEMMNHKARLLQRGRKLDDAVKVATRAMQKQPARLDAYVTLVDILGQAKRPADAKKVLEQAAQNVDDKARLAQVRSVYNL